MGVFTEDSRDHTDAEQDESESDETLAPMVQTLRKAEIELEDCDTEDGHCEGMAEGVGHAEAQAAAPVALHGGDVRDSCEVIVVKAVAQAQQEA